MATRFIFRYGIDFDNSAVMHLILAEDLDLTDSPDPTYAPGDPAASPTTINEWATEWEEGWNGVKVDTDGLLSAEAQRLTPSLTGIIYGDPVAITRAGDFPGGASEGPLGMKGEYIYFGAKNSQGFLTKVGWARVGSDLSANPKRFSFASLSGAPARTKVFIDLLNRNTIMGINRTQFAFPQLSVLKKLNLVCYHGVKG